MQCQSIEERRDEKHSLLKKYRLSLFGLFLLPCAVSLIAVIGPTHRMAQERSHKLHCARQLKTLTNAAIQYSQDHQYFPHMAAAEAPQYEHHIYKVFQSLIYLGYLDNPQLFNCSPYTRSSSRLQNVTNQNSRQWYWGEQANPTPQRPPVLAPTPFDFYGIEDLAYSARHSQLAARDARSDSLIFADKFDLYQELINHMDGVTVGYGDGHVRFLEKDQKEWQDVIRNISPSAPFSTDCSGNPRRTISSEFYSQSK